MHELSLLENLREIVQTEAERQQFSQVKTLTLEIGSLSCIETDALRFGFDVVMQDSPAANAQLIIETLIATGICQHCEQSMTMHNLQQCCEHCGQFGVTLQQGNSMRIKDMLVI